MGWSHQRARYQFLQDQEVTCFGLDLTLVVRFNEIRFNLSLVVSLSLAPRRVPWNERGRRLVELTEGWNSEGDSQDLQIFKNPLILGIPTFSFQ